MTNLTRSDMEALINKGQSVMYRGVVYKKIADLPTQYEMDSINQDAAADSILPIQPSNVILSEVVILPEGEAGLTSDFPVNAAGKNCRIEVAYMGDDIPINIFADAKKLAGSYDFGSNQHSLEGSGNGSIFSFEAADFDLLHLSFGSDAETPTTADIPFAIRVVELQDRTKDAGPAWIRLNFNQQPADATEGVGFTNAPTLGTRMIIDDLFISSELEVLVTILETAGDGDEVCKFYLPAKIPVQLTFRGGLVGSASGGVDAYYIKTNIASQLYLFGTSHEENI